MTKSLYAALLVLSLPFASPASAGGLFGMDNRGDLSSTMGKASAPRQLGSNAMNPLPPTDFVGQWYTTPDMCTYSRAQAPGYAVHWYLVLNPHHIGMPNAHSGCPARL